MSFVQFGYNQEEFIRDAIEGAFSQTYSPLEIILSDDCSKDRTFEIMRELASAYKGPHKVILNQNKENKGIGRHFNKVMELASGEVVELAAGDDISMPYRTEESWKILDANPKLTCVSLGLVEFTDVPILPKVPENEKLELKVHDISEFVNSIGFHINAPARAFRKYTHDYFGPLCEDCPVEDSPNLFRCLLHGKAAFYPLKGVLYRRTENALSAPHNLRKIPFELIYKEYEHSLAIACKKGLISEKTFKVLEKSLATKWKKREICMRLSEANFGIRSYVMRMLFSTYFSPKEKAVHFRSLIQAKSHKILSKLRTAI